MAAVAKKSKIGNRTRDVHIAGHREGFAAVGAFRKGKVFQIGFDEVGYAVQDAETSFGRAGCPIGESLLRGGNSLSYVGSIGIGNEAVNLSGSGVYVV